MSRIGLSGVPVPDSYMEELAMMSYVGSPEPMMELYMRDEAMGNNVNAGTLQDWG